KNCVVRSAQDQADRVGLARYEVSLMEDMCDIDTGRGPKEGRPRRSDWHEARRCNTTACPAGRLRQRRIDGDNGFSTRNLPGRSAAIRITALPRGLFVIACNSSFTYKGRAVDVKQVGREVGVH